MPDERRRLLEGRRRGGAAALVRRWLNAESRKEIEKGKKMDIANTFIPILCALIGGAFEMAGRRRPHAKAARECLDLYERMRNVDDHCASYFKKQARIEVMQDESRPTRVAATWLYPGLALPLAMHLAIDAQALTSSYANGDASTGACYLALAVAEALALAFLMCAYISAEKEKRLDAEGDCEELERRAVNACATRMQAAAFVMFAAALAAHAIASLASYEIAQSAIMVVMNIELVAVFIRVYAESRD